MGVIVASAVVASGHIGMARAAPLSDADRDDIARAETYLNSMRTLRSSFVQTATNGSVAEGTLYIQRPGKLRIDYKPPVPLQLYGDGFWLIYVDTELEEVNQLPIEATPAAFLVRDTMRLSGDVSVRRVVRRRGTIDLHLSQADDPEAGRLIITFAAKPLALRGWTVIDAQGVETTVTLIKPDLNQTIARNIFIFDPPDWALAPQD